ncbi:MAG: dockerin type I repeat-containing protein [Deltaproteobacteria bacterium]|nr:dockerin type I repeat-containing protein [Deltaproteobacteria bacterium]
MAVHSYAGISSEHYRIPRSVLSGGGDLMVSGTYSSKATLGQPSAIGPSSGSVYLVQGGFWHAIQSIAPGDVNGDGNINLADLILSLQIMTRTTTSDVRRQADVDHDVKIGLTEAIYVLGKIAGLRE